MVSRVSGRVRRRPRGFEDYEPSSLVGLPMHIRPLPPPPAPEPPPLSVPLPVPSIADLDEGPGPVLTPFRTELNSYGMYREYTVKPQRDPEEHMAASQRCDPRAFPAVAPSTDGRIPSAFTEFAAARTDPAVEGHPPTFDAITSTPVDLYAPLRNASEFRLLNWQYAHGNTSSNIAVNHLINDVLLAPDFSVDDLRGGFTIEGAQARLDKGSEAAEAASPFSPRDGWIKTSVKIRVPKEGTKFASEDDAPEFEIPDVYYRSLLDVIMAVFQSASAAGFHYIPFKQYWRPSFGTNASGPFTSTQSSAEDVRIRSEYYNSDAMLEDDTAMRAEPRQPGDPPGLEYFIAGLCLWSDSTHLAQFGSASLWPIYNTFSTGVATPRSIRHART